MSFKNIGVKNKPTYLSLLLFLLGAVAIAQIQEPFAIRYSQSMEGDFTIIANNVISRTATGSYNGGLDNHNFQDNVYVDIDNDNTTFNSSSANFTNPTNSGACITIFRAFLYWAAADTEQPNGDDNQPNWNFNDVKLMLPGQTTYSTLTADDVIFRGRTTHFSNDPYICVKDITSLVQALPNKYGNYQVANVEAAEGTVAHDDLVGTAGGWQIVFVYESPGLPSKNITLFDGYAHVTGQVNDFDINFSGFQTTPVGNVNANLVLGALEGDRGLAGDRLQILNAANNFVDITAPQRTANNFFNSRITVGNGNYVDRNPASTNTLGFDAASFELDNTGNSIITNNQTSATLRLTSNQEIYGLYLLGLAVEIYSPSLSPMVITQTSGSNPSNPGDIIGFNFNFENSGNDDAINVVLSTTIPPQATLLPITNLPNGVTYTYNSITGDLVFNVADGILNVGSPALDIGMELQLNDECYFLEDDCDLTFDLQFTATYSGAQHPGQIITVSTSDPNSCVALPYTVVINQPVVNWLTAAGALNANLSCDDAAGLANAQTLEPVPDKCTFTLIKTSGPLVQGSCPGTGTYTNTWNFTDACGVTIADYVQTITIADNTPPTASNPPAINVSCISDVPAPDVSVVNDEADNCSNPVVAFVSDASDNQSCPETITRTYSVTDACGNAINVTQLIIILDDIFPTASNPAAINVQCIEDVPAPDINVVTDASDNCAAPTVAFVSDVSDNQSCPETITRTYSVTDACGNFILVTQNIVILDDIPPTASNPLSINVQCIEDVPAPDISVVTDASDNCATPIVAFVSDVSDNLSCPETITRTYSVTDTCNNSILLTQFIIIFDDIAPTASNPQSILVDCGESAPAPDISVITDAFDNCANPTIAFVSDVSDNQSCPETITRTYSVTDTCGNSIFVTQQIILPDDEAPTASNPPTIYAQCIEDVPLPDSSVVTDAIDNCSDVTVEFVSDELVGEGCPLTVARTYSITDGCGNRTEVIQMIIVNDDIAPELITQFEPLIRVMCGDVPRIPELEFVDNCSTNLLVDYSEEITIFDDNTYTIYRFWAVADACNNESIFMQTVEMRSAGDSTNEVANLCVTDEPIDLNLFITNTTELGGEWTSENLDVLDGSVFDPSETGTGNFEFIYSYTENSCSWNTIVSITVDRSCMSDSCLASSDDVSISKLVTPNNDGYNDFFEVNYEIVMERATLCNITVDVEVFNRWGQRVFRMENYQNDWGGNSPSGSVGGSGVLPTGTYYYIVTLNESGINPIKGFILLGAE